MNYINDQDRQRVGLKASWGLTVMPHISMRTWRSRNILKNCILAMSSVFQFFFLGGVCQQTYWAMGSFFLGFFPSFFTSCTSSTSLQVASSQSNRNTNPVSTLFTVIPCASPRLICPLNAVFISTVGMPFNKTARILRQHSQREQPLSRSSFLRASILSFRSCSVMMDPLIQ